MKCPKCHIQLVTKKYGDIVVDHCTECRGLWLEIDELDRLEDKVFDKDEHKGTMIFSSTETNLSCPKCSDPLQEFRYRLYELKLDFCKNDHGFWLDRDEEKRVLEIMKKEFKDTIRKYKAEGEWENILKKLKSKPYWQKN